MQDLSLHILDIAENATRAGGKIVIIKIIEDKIKDTLNLSIEDDGKGMDKETVDKVMDPFFTTKNSKKIGLGLSLLAQAAQQTGGELKIESQQGKGTKVTAVFQLSNIDMKPMGNIVETMTALVLGNPTTQFILDYKKGDDSFYFDSLQQDRQ
jgi:signal transduction histidine kinase